MRKIFPYFCNKKCQLFSQTKVTFRSWDYTIIMLVERERVTLNLGTGWGNYCPRPPSHRGPVGQLVTKVFVSVKTDANYC